MYIYVSIFETQKDAFQKVVLELIKATNANIIYWTVKTQYFGLLNCQDVKHDDGKLKTHIM